MTELERFSFDPEYVVVSDPEFPGNGDWGCAVHGFARDGNVVPEIQSTWGAPLVGEVTLAEGGRWVGMFEASGLGGTTGLFATPSPGGLCAVVDGLAYLVDVENPERGAALMKHQVHQVVGAQAEPPLLLVVGPTDLVAVGIDGIEWATPRLAVDDLRVEFVKGNRITCSLDSLGGSPTIVLDAKTGDQIEGTRLDSFWPHGAA